MNRRDLPVLLIGIALLGVAYVMKKNGIEGFQANLPSMGAPMAPPMPPMPPPMPPMPPSSTPPMPPPMPPSPMPRPPGPSTASPPGAPPMAPMGMTQPQPMGMQPNQQQLMDIVGKVQRMSSDTSMIAAQLQQMTQSFGTTEGFQSMENPYNSPSPGDTQTLEFRLGKKSLVDGVLRY